jgi:hypothetical protein
MSAKDHLGEQFFTANPNQMALPGMEEHSHPGAKALSQGYRFEHERTVARVGPWATHYHSLKATHPDVAASPEVGMDREVAAKLDWRDQGGEISMVQTQPSQQRQGLATALYGIGRTMTTRKPQHSPRRTIEGNAWAPAASKKYGGRVPKEPRSRVRWY